MYCRKKGPIMRATVIIFLMATIGLPVFAEPLTLVPQQVTDWKAVYGRIEARDRIPARARLGGTLVALSVVEGDVVAAGQVLARIVDEKIAFQLSAADAQLDAVKAQLENAKVELKRGEDLLKQGVTTVQRLDGLRTQVDVLNGQIASLAAQRRVIEQQAAEGEVKAPVAGRVLQVPLAKGAVVMPGEAIATLGGGGIFLRIAVPERHAANLHEGDTIQIDTVAGPQTGKLARVYPLIENGRVVADVEVPDLPDTFIDARVLVRLPVGTHAALMVPATAITLHSGLDFVISNKELRVIVPGVHEVMQGVDMVEVLSGLQAGDVIETEGSQHD
jgi:RND family efflux transporter MFP subunit